MMAVQEQRAQGQRVVVAMSGGVDSSVAAALLVERGYEVIGLMLRLWGEPGQGAENRCCTPDAVGDARRVARVVGIPFYLLNCERRFKDQVVDPFVRQYAGGLTPNPCLACNRHIKFGYLLQMALTLGAAHIATGHYARVQQVDGQYRLLRGVDPAKDQSYVLYMLGQEQLRHTLFPIGAYRKPEVREMATKWRLPVADKQDSQDICFVRDQDYRRFVQDRASEAIRPGPILDAAGREIGRHKGLPFFTIGQRRGLGIAWLEPLYVLEMDASRNALIVGPASALGTQRLRVTDTSFVSGQQPRLPVPVTVQTRYSGREVAGMLYPGEDGKGDVHLDSPVRDAAPGQAAVFWQGEVLLGGGIIEHHLLR
jgi:tRNA-specific 2-thiouridylase